MYFPLPFLPTIDYHSPGLGWNADRTKVGKMHNAQVGWEEIPGGVLKHAAVDLIGPPGTPILAVDRGSVIRQPYPFFDGTYAFEIKHPRFIARYCEVAPKTEVQAGDWVEAGQVIAYIGVQTYVHKMLHFELYSSLDTSSLFVGYAKEFAPFYRRKDVYNPIPTLDSIAHTAMRNVSKAYEYEFDALDRKFLKKLTLNDI